jgi:mono/diheme cytochrome c family protein
VVQARKGELILAECAACHDGKVGPALPFLDSKMLSRQLTVGKYRHGTLWEEIIYRLSPQAGNEQMPLGENLSENEIRNLEDYLAQLKSRGSE